MSFWIPGLGLSERAEKMKVKIHIDVLGCPALVLDMLSIKRGL